MTVTITARIKSAQDIAIAILNSEEPRPAHIPIDHIARVIMDRINEESRDLLTYLQTRGIPAKSIDRFAGLEQLSFDNNGWISIQLVAGLMLSSPVNQSEVDTLMSDYSESKDPAGIMTLKGVVLEDVVIGSNRWLAIVGALHQSDFQNQLGRWETVVRRTYSLDLTKVKQPESVVFGECRPATMAEIEAGTVPTASAAKKSRPSQRNTSSVIKHWIGVKSGQVLFQIPGGIIEWSHVSNTPVELGKVPDAREILDFASHHLPKIMEPFRKDSGPYIQALSLSNGTGFESLSEIHNLAQGDSVIYYFYMRADGRAWTFMSRYDKKIEKLRKAILTNYLNQPCSKTNNSSAPSAD